MTRIQGPLGIWPFPILNTLIELSENQNQNDTQQRQQTQDNLSVKEFNVVRDENGNLEKIEVVEGNT